MSTFKVRGAGGDEGADVRAGRAAARVALSGAVFDVDVSDMSLGAAYGEAAALGVNAVAGFMAELYTWVQVAMHVAAEAQGITIEEAVGQVMTAIDMAEPGA
jgi:hypothetical protein